MTQTVDSHRFHDVRRPENLGMDHAFGEVESAATHALVTTPFVEATHIDFEPVVVSGAGRVRLREVSSDAGAGAKMGRDVP